MSRRRWLGLPAALVLAGLLLQGGLVLARDHSPLVLVTRVFDAAGYGGIETDHMQETPDRLRKGRSVTGEFGFAVPKGAKTDIVFTFVPGWDYSDATFTGRG